MVNVAGILRGKEDYGVVLDSPFGQVTFDYIDDDNRLIVCHFINEGGKFVRVSFDFLGRYSGVLDKCVLFPAGKTDWSDSAFGIFKEGEYLFVECHEYEYIIKYAGIDENGFVRRYAAWNDDFGFSDADRPTCKANEVTAVRPASKAEKALLQSFMDNND